MYRYKISNIQSAAEDNEIDSGVIDLEIFRWQERNQRIPGGHVIQNLSTPTQ